MIKPPYPIDEAERLATLRRLDILDTRSEERFDRLTRLARRLFDVPIALVSLVDADRLWFKSRQGLDATETPRDISFCGHAILGDEVMVVSDASRDDRFEDNPLVVGDPRIRFYAGLPLRAGNGSKLGTLCLIDRAPRSMSGNDLRLLDDLASMGEEELAAIQLATTDELTGLSNRRGFETLAVHALAVCRRTERAASLLLLDLDGFKEINDTFGHAEGDRALVDFGRTLLGTFRDSDVVARLGGDEFCVLLTGTGSTGVRDALRRFDDAIRLRNGACPYGPLLSYSAGAVDYDGKRDASVAELMREADEAMYTEKRARRRELSE